MAYNYGPSAASSVKFSQPGQTPQQWADETGGTFEIDSLGNVVAKPADLGIMDRIATGARYAIPSAMVAYNAATLPGLLGGAPAAAPVAESGLLPATMGAPAGLAVGGGVPATVAGATSGLGVGATAGGLSGSGFMAEAGRGIMSRITDAAHNAAGPVVAGINQYTENARSDRGDKLTYAQEQERLRQNAMSEFERELIARETENRTAGKDAMQRVQSDSYNMQRKPYTPPTIHSNVAGVKDQTLPNFGIGRTNAPTADEIAALTADRDRSRDRLMSGSQLPPLVDPTQSAFYTQPNPNLNPGTMERIGRIASPAISIWDKISKFL